MVWRTELSAKILFFRMACNYGFQVLFLPLWLPFILATCGSSSMPKKAANPFFSSFHCRVSFFLFCFPFQCSHAFLAKKVRWTFHEIIFCASQNKRNFDDFLIFPLLLSFVDVLLWLFWLQQETDETLKGANQTFKQQNRMCKSLHNFSKIKKL